MFANKRSKTSCILAAAALGSAANLLSAHAAKTVPTKAGKATIKIDAQAGLVLKQLAALHPKPIPMLSPAQARKQPSPATAVGAILKKRHKPLMEPVGSVVNTTITPAGGRAIPVRVYKPLGKAKATGLPVLVYFHGGGFVIANLDTYDSSCRALSNAAGALVISVAYRQAPENPFPAAPEDAYAATQWTMNNVKGWGGNPAKVAVGGESAGGNLATVVCLMAKDRKGKMPIHQLLVYPVANWATTGQPSVIKYAHAKPLDGPMLAWFRGHYLKNPRDITSPYASPQLGNVRGLPAATVVQAEIDPLQSQGTLYVAKLRAAGVPVTAMMFRNVPHEFFGQGAVVAKAKAAVVFAAAGLKKAYR